jgi:peptidoglycan/LPS O-acetylase OafA/YrhL
MPAVLKGRERLSGVDALRGAAAIAVLLYHFTLRPTPLVPLGFLGVEVFFSVSGFILAYAYEDALDGGMSAIAYAGQRWIRLYPVYALGLGFGFATYLLSAVLRGATNPAWSVAIALAKGVFLIPTMQRFVVGEGAYLESAPLYPFDNPSWSLLIEVACSAAFLFWRPRGRALLATLTLLGLVFAVSAVRVNGVGGFNQGTLLLGFPRGLFCFYGGLALYRLWRAGAFATLPRSSLAAVALLGIGSLFKLTFASFLAVVFVGAPLLIVLATAEPRSAPVKRAFQWLGDISYPLYLLHLPLFALARLLATVWGGWPAGEPWPRAAALALAPVALILAHGVARLYDAPTRRWLRDRLFGPRPAPMRQDAPATA